MSSGVSEPRPFTWADLGDIEAGRPNLGPTAPVLAYRLLQYTWRHVMVAELGEAEGQRAHHQGRPARR